MTKKKKNLQHYRRRKNNEDIPVQPFYYPTIDGNYSNRPYLYCTYHEGYLTKSLSLVHHCEEKHCSRIDALCLDFDEVIHDIQ